MRDAMTLSAMRQRGYGRQSRKSSGRKIAARALSFEQLEIRVALATYSLNWDGLDEPSFVVGQNLAAINTQLDTADIPVAIGSHNSPSWQIADDGGGNRIVTGERSPGGADFYGNFTDDTGANRVAMQIGPISAPTTAILRAYAEPIVDGSLAGLAGLTVVGTQSLTISGNPTDQLLNFDLSLASHAQSFAVEIAGLESIVNVDFQSDTPGTVPSALALDQQNGATTIVTTTSAATDPFGVPGNQSMRLVDQNNGSVGYRAVIPFVADTSTESLTDLTIEMDMVLKAPAPDWTISLLWIGDTLGNGPQWFADGPAVQVFPAVNTNGIASVGQLGGYYSQSAAGGGGSVITPDVPFHLKIVTNSATSTYNVFVDGVKLGWDFGSGTVFDMPTEGTDTINQITFTSEGLGVPSSGEVFIDNFRVTHGDNSGSNSILAINSLEWDSISLVPAIESTAIGEWHEFRGNGQHTGRAEVTGSIVDPKTIWSQFIGSRESWAELTLNGSGLVNTALPTVDIAIDQSSLINWGVGGEWYDLDGDGSLESYGTSGLSKIGDFLPLNPGLELLEVHLSPSPNPNSEGFVTLSKRMNRNWTQVWQSITIPLINGPSIIAGDFDNDGQLEVGIVPWYDLYVLNMTTGAVEDSATFKNPAAESGRAYGFHGAYDINGDGRSEFVIMGDFQNFVAVMGWDANGNLVKLWDYLIDVPVHGKTTVHRPGIEPVADITGDGRLEVATTVFNDNGDQRWHTVVYNGMTGAVILDLVDHYLDGMRDVDGDGKAELFVTLTSGSAVPTTGPVRILKVNGGSTTVLWEQSGVAFHSQQLPKLPTSVNTGAATGRLALLAGPVQAGGEDVFFTRRSVNSQTGIFEILAWRSDGAGNISQVGAMVGPDLEVLAVRENAGGGANLLVRAEVFTENQSGMLSTTGMSRSYVYSALKGPPRSSAVVGRLGGAQDRPTVIVQGGGEQLVALQPYSNGSVNRIWTSPGRGTFSGAEASTGEHGFGGATLADLLGNGQLATLSASRSESGLARMQALAADGSILWTSDFDAPGDPPIWNQGGLTMWQVGRFNAPNRDDVLVTIRQGSFGTEKFYMLDGRTGEVLWTRDWGNTPGFGDPRAAGGAQQVVYDWDNDGLEEAINFYPDKFYVVDGNGVNLINRDFTNSIFGSVWPFYGNPIAADFLNNGTTSLLYGGGYQILGLLDRQGNAIWQTPYQPEGYPGFIQGVGDVDGDGDLDLLSPGHQVTVGSTSKSEFRAYDAATGSLLWKVPLPGSPFGPIGYPYVNSPTLSVSADLDNDGRDESIFAIGSTLYVVGANPSGTGGQFKWGKTLQGNLGSPIVADTTGDGKLEIIVVSDNGYIYSIGDETPIPGDFNNDGNVDTADYQKWKSDFGKSMTPFAGADGNGNGVIDTADYTIWRSHVGSGSAAVQGAAAVSQDATVVGENTVTAQLLPSTNARGPADPTVEIWSDASANSRTINAEGENQYPIIDSNSRFAMRFVAPPSSALTANAALSNRHHSNVFTVEQPWTALRPGLELVTSLNQSTRDSILHTAGSTDIDELRNDAYDRFFDLFANSQDSNSSFTFDDLASRQIDGLDFARSLHHSAQFSVCKRATSWRHGQAVRRIHFA